jgi:hypothetical protein
MAGMGGTDANYASVSGNWRRYFRRLLATKERSKHLTLDMLMDLLAKQGDRCALTGEPLTCILIRGTRTWTNASIDRIDASGDYKLENIQLVCTAVNGFRGNLGVQEFVRWCKLVAEHDAGKKADKKAEKVNGRERRKAGPKVSPHADANPPAGGRVQRAPRKREEALDEQRCPRQARRGGKGKEG